MDEHQRIFMTKA